MGRSGGLHLPSLVGNAVCPLLECVSLNDDSPGWIDTLVEAFFLQTCDPPWWSCFFFPSTVIIIVYLLSVLIWLKYPRTTPDWGGLPGVFTIPNTITYIRQVKPWRSAIFPISSDHLSLEGGLILHHLSHVYYNPECSLGSSNALITLFYFEPVKLSLALLFFFLLPVIPVTHFSHPPPFAFDNR